MLCNHEALQAHLICIREKGPVSCHLRLRGVHEARDEFRQQQAEVMENVGWLPMVASQHKI